MHRPQNPPAAGLHVASNPHCRIGENPLWHPTHRKLYWCDIPFGRLYAFDPETRTTELLHDGTHDGTLLGGFTIQHDGALLLFMDHGRIDRWTPASSQTLVPPHPSHAGMRFNDVIADPVGRVFCGTMSLSEPLDASPGNLYRLDHDATLTPILTNVLCSNGLAFTRNARHLFHTDSLRRTITRFDYDLATGTLSRPVRTSRTASPTASPSTPKTTSGPRTGAATASSATLPTAASKVASLYPPAESPA